MTREVEDIVKNKSYNELTSVERDQIREWAQSEAEYDEIRSFLAGTSIAFNEAKIKASPNLKKGVLEHLTASKKKKGFWLNSVGVFMLPSHKSFYQKPAFQLGIAALAVVGFLVYFNNNGLNAPNLALNQASDKITTVEEFSEQHENEEVLPVEEELLLENKETIEGPLNVLENAVLREEQERVELAPPIPPTINSIEIVEDDLELDVEELVVDSDMSMFDMEEAEESLEEEYTVEADEIMPAGVLEKTAVYSDNSIKYEEESIVPANELFKLGKNRMLEVEKKKERNRTVSEQVDRDKNELAATGSLKQKEILSEDLVTKDGEWIIPKALHIDKTKELNALFFTVK